MKTNKALEGVVSISPKGTGYIKIQDFKNEIEIDFKHLNTALNGDKVSFILHPHNKKDRKINGEIIQIVKRAKKGFSGILEKEGNIYFVKTDDNKMYNDILIPKEKLNGAKEKEKVFVEITHWKDHKKIPEGRIIEILGEKGQHETEIKAISLENGFRPHLPEEIEREAKKIKEKGIEQKEYTKRRDFRRTLTFTIDPFDAKDFDDAISFKEIEKEEYEIGVHIADVTHYVKPKSKIDEEAKERATSVYLVDRTIPMLPEVLSNDLCSLVPHKDRLVFSVLFKINKNGDVKNVWFGEGIINSQHRFSYEEAEETIKDEKKPLYKELNTINEIAKKLTKNRIQNGALIFEKNEVKFILDDNKIPIKIIKKESLQAHHLIEEFMLLANKKVAEVFKKNKKTFIYRLHDQPNKEKMEDILYILKSIKYPKVKVTSGIIPNREINKIMKDFKDRKEREMLGLLFIRSMAKAYYGTKNIGHYGLQFKDYTHFTSPIRRYPDIIVHRILKDFLKIERWVEKKEEIEQICINSSEQEKKASDAERQSIKFKQVQYMSDKKANKFKGIITGISEWGIFVEEENSKCEGLIHIKNMSDDFYFFDEKNITLIGKRTKKKYKLGDNINIKVKETNLEKRTIDYEII